MHRHLGESSSPLNRQKEYVDGDLVEMRSTIDFSNEEIEIEVESAFGASKRFDS